MGNLVFIALTVSDSCRQLAEHDEGSADIEGEKPEGVSISSRGFDAIP